VFPFWKHVFLGFLEKFVRVLCKKLSNLLTFKIKRTLTEKKEQIDEMYLYKGNEKY
jgi:hypothetical protein